MENFLFGYIVVLFFGLIIGSVISYYIIRTSVKDSLKQTEYYLEIIAKKALEDSKKTHN